MTICKKGGGIGTTLVLALMQTRVYDRDFSPLNLRPDDELVKEVRAAAVEEIEQAARKNDILHTAERNAEGSIRAFVTTLGFERVEFE